MVAFYSHEAMKYCYIKVDGILCIQLVIGFIACRMLSHFMYFVRNDEIKMFNHVNIGIDTPGDHTVSSPMVTFKNALECNFPATPLVSNLD